MTNADDPQTLDPHSKGNDTQVTRDLKVKNVHTTNADKEI